MFWLPVLLFWGAAVALNWAMLANRYRHFLNDTDDALRLVQWRLFRDGAGWHDLLIARMGAPEGLESHWSRLIDAGLLLLYWPFALVMPEPEAETAMRLVWPLLLLLPAMTAVAMIAHSTGGRKAVIPALLLATLALPVQFTPGRIDHHNAQIVLLMLSWAFLFVGLRRHGMMLPAGLLVAMTLGVGLEALLPVLFVPASAVLIWAVAPRDTGRALALFGIGLLTGALLMLISAQPPSRFMQTACDAYAANWGLTLMLVGAGLALLPLIPDPWLASRVRRLGAAGAIAVLATALFVILDPLCLQGPFAGMPEVVRAGWLAHVKEMQGLADILARSDAQSIWLAIAVWSALSLLLWRLTLRRKGLSWLAETMLAGATLSTFVLGMMHIRVLAYAQWLSLPLMAIALARCLQGPGRFRQGLRAASALFLSPMSLMVAVMIALPLAGLRPGQTPSPNRKPDAVACQKDEALIPLAELPPGLLAGDLALQVFILARTPHRVLAGPYHRLADRIESNIRLFAEPPDRARRRALTLGLDYIAVCPGARMFGPDGHPVGAASLWGHLLRGEIPDWLEPVPLAAPTPIRVYRVRANRPLPAVIDLPDTLTDPAVPPPPSPPRQQKPLARKPHSPPTDRR